MKKLIISTFAILATLSLTGCGTDKKDTGTENKKIVVGATSAPHAIILNEAKAIMAEKGYTLEVKEFTDWVPLNPSTSDDTLDVNYFQHQPFLDGYNKDSKLEEGTEGYLVSVGAIHFEPLGIYAFDPQGKTSISADDVNDGDKIAVPNDATNEARALLLLEKYGIITLKEGAGINATIKDIETKVKDIEFYEIDAAQVSTKLQDVKYAIINGNFALDAKIIDKLICSEDKDDEAAKQYANIVVVKEENKDSEAVKVLVEVLKSDEIKEFINTEFEGVVLPA